MEDKEVIQLFIDHLKKHHNLSDSEIYSFINNKEIIIPVSILKSDLSALQSICKYLKENLDLSLNKISKILNKDNKTIWASYNNAIKKQKEKITIKDNKYYIPISKISSNNLPILASIIKYLKEDQDLNYHEIGIILNRNEKNIWSIYNKNVKNKKP